MVVLRYFDACGRAQPLRNALTDAGVAFEDLRVPTDTWATGKDDPDFGGPFGALPTLTWDGETFAETLPIARVLARRLGHLEGLDEAAAARLEAVCSCCYIDVMLALGDLIWVDVLYPGADVATALPRHLGKIRDRLMRVDALLPEEGWLGGARPVVADFFVGEAVEVHRRVLGVDPSPRLGAHADRLRARPTLAAAWAARPPRFTVHPDEAGAIARLRALASS